MTDRVLSTERTDVTGKEQNTRQGRKTMALEEKNGGALKKCPLRACICPSSRSSSASRIGSSSTRHAEQTPTASPYWQRCWQCRFGCDSSRHSCQSCRAFSSLAQSDVRIAALRVLFQCASNTRDGSVGIRGPRRTWTAAFHPFLRTRRRTRQRQRRSLLTDALDALTSSSLPRRALGDSSLRLGRVKALPNRSARYFHTSRMAAANVWNLQRMDGDVDARRLKTLFSLLPRRP